MTTRKQVIIFDDEDGPRRDWVKGLAGVPTFADGFEARTVSTSDFKTDLDLLRRRKAAARHGQEISDATLFFDGTDILIVDYDLLELDETGEEVAYLARCFSTCGIIIAVNQFAREGFTFDLTLRGHPESFADLNLLAGQIFDVGLWGVPWAGFRPWYWPLLPFAVTSFEERVRDIMGNLDEKIFDFLKIPPSVRAIFPIEALEFISSEDATFRSFVSNSGQALRWKDKVVSDLSVARIAAARLSKWLERLVLPGQNILVDAAHLVERYPSLFRENHSKGLIGWPNVYSLLDPVRSLDLAKISQYRFEKSAWLSRTSWYWPLVSECDQIPEVADPWAPRPEVAFCEDTSIFSHPTEAVEFVAKVDSPFVRRFVSTRDSNYGPKLQFAL